MDKNRVRQVVLGVIAADFPLMYLGAITLENSALTIAALAIMGVTAALAAVVY